MLTAGSVPCAGPASLWRALANPQSLLAFYVHGETRAIVANSPSLLTCNALSMKTN
jgi:hypothetical protein